MIQVAGKAEAARAIRQSLSRFGLRLGAIVAVLATLYWGFSARVNPDELGVVQKRFGSKTGIVDRVFGPGLYFVLPGTTMHTFPRTIHVLEATYDEAESLQKARDSEVQEKVQRYFKQRGELLGTSTHRVIEALNVQTSDGYAVRTDVTLLFRLEDPVKIAREFGWGSLYMESFVINTFRNGVLSALGKMNAESFFNEQVRIAAVEDAQKILSDRFHERGFLVERLLIRNYQYADNYEKSLHDKKVAVQLTVKNRKEAIVNEEKAKLQQIESKGNATITIAESQVNADIARINAEAELYASQTRARADTEYNIAMAEAKRLKAEALNIAGGRYVVALETAKMFESVQSAIMTPEQYINFVRNAWSLIGVSAGSPPARPADGGGRP